MSVINTNVQSLVAQSALTVNNRSLSKAPKLAVPDKPDLTLDPQQRKRDLSEAIEKINSRMRADGRALSFSLDETADRMVITVKNSETGRVVRQIPDETLLRVAHRLEDIKGLLQDERI